jgi:hypothetical protein
MNAGDRQLQRHGHWVRQLAFLRGIEMLAASPGSRHSSAEGGGSTGVFGVRLTAEKKNNSPQHTYRIWDRPSNWISKSFVGQDIGRVEPRSDVSLPRPLNDDGTSSPYSSWYFVWCGSTEGRAVCSNRVIAMVGWLARAFLFGHYWPRGMQGYISHGRSAGCIGILCKLVCDSLNDVRICLCETAWLEWQSD